VQNKFQPPQKKRKKGILLNVQSVNDLDTPTITAINPRCDKCACDHLTNQCHRKGRSSDVRCVLCGGNHPANYKGCTVYKDLQKKTYPPLRLKIYTPLAQIKQTLHTQPGVTYAHITKQNSYSPTNRERITHKEISSGNQRYTGIKKYDGKPFWKNGTMLNFLTTVLNKLK
jgi:hypothetical protein